MGVRRARDVRLGAPDHDPVGPPLDDVDVQVGVGLLPGGEGPVPLRVGHRPGRHEVLPLQPGQERPEPLVILRPLRLVDVVRHRPEGVDRVEPDTPLEAGPRLPPDEPEHGDLPDQVVDAPEQVRETGDLRAVQVRRRGHDLVVLPARRQVVRRGRGLDVGRERPMFVRIFKQFPAIVNPRLELFQAFDVLRTVHHRASSCERLSHSFRNSFFIILPPGFRGIRSAIPTWTGTL